jgi:hypothetical protein
MKGLLSVVIVVGLLVAGIAVALLFMVFSAVRLNLSLVVTATLQAGLGRGWSRLLCDEAPPPDLIREF